jgi:ABC-type phosphate/phosphonate transport system, periplasmic component
MKNLFALLFLWLLTAPAFADTYTFGVVPQFEQRKTFAIWSPILAELEKRTGQRFELVTTATIPAFEKLFNDGKVDFAYMNPYYMVENVQGYLPLVRDDKPIVGILVVRRDSPYQTPADLEGKEVAFPSPNAIGASLLIRADLARQFHVNIVPRYVKSHSSVYLHVAQGLTAGGGGVVKTLEEQKPEVKDALRVLYTTRSIPSHPVSAHPRIPKKVREAVREALLALASTPEGKPLLAEVPMTRPVAAYAKDYEPMRGYGMDDLFVREQ